MQWDIHRVKETGSTNEDAFMLGRSGAPAGIVCVADSQHHGRGRMDRSWFSPPGVGLYCSVLLRPALSIRDAGLLSFCAALAMTETIRAYGLHAFIKWPNDIVCENRKICGILSACDGDASHLRFAVIGTGLNILPGSYPEELRSHAACLADFGVNTNSVELLSKYLEALSVSVETLERDGFAAIRRLLESFCVNLHRPVRVSGGQSAEGIAESIGDHGELILRSADGTLLPITCGDVSIRGVNSYV